MMNRRRFFHIASCVLLLLLLLLNPVRGAAQSRAVINGTVTDQNGAFIPNAEVRLLSLDGVRLYETRTDSGGKYQLKELPTGSFQLTVTSAGFAVIPRSITLRASSIVTEDFTLAPAVVTGTITVTAGKGSERAAVYTPESITVTDSLQIEERRPRSTLQAIERAPNLTGINSNPALERPRLRGLASNRLLIIVDGERLNNVRSDPLSGVAVGVIDVTQLESAEVTSGGSSLYGSDAIGGIINLITRAPVRADGASSLSLRFDGNLYGNGPFRRGAVGLSFSARKVAARVSGALFRGSNYSAGNRSISLEDVVSAGRFLNEMGNATGNNVARTYAVWSLPAGAEILNGQSQGFNHQLDLWLFPTVNESVRYRQLNSQHKKLGFPFIAPPFDQRNQFNGFRRLDKYSVRYEGRKPDSRLSRLAGGFYWQKYSFDDGTITSPIQIGSSWDFVASPLQPQLLVPFLTGRPSVFTAGNFTDGKNSVTSYSFDAQASFTPARGLLITTGAAYLKDSSKDEFTRTDFVQNRTTGGRASNPDSDYRNLGWFNLVEYEPRAWLRLVGGLRVDNWRTEAKVTSGFPIGAESAILQSSLTNLAANPGPINLEGTNGLLDLIAGTRGISTSRTIVTGNIGAVLRLPGGFNPYLRWSNSYREPGITERYILRDFGDPTFSVLVIPNTALKPERGRLFEAGLKAQRTRWSASLGYFDNRLEDFIRSVFADPIFVAANPGAGLNPISPFFPFHGVLYVQRTNTARARIRGFEMEYEVRLPLSRLGLITPFGTLGALKGSNLTPDEDTLTLIRQFYNRDDTPVRLTGTEQDAPLSNITPLRAIFGARFDSRSRRWFGEYEARYQARVTRADPLDLTSTISTQYGTLASLSPFTRQSVRLGYNYNRESYRATFTIGLENLTDRFYFEHFQTAPAPGRSLLFGTTIELFNLLR
ncbi:MAG: TonB-dependent receptor [Pyrinomonadaceae bacterium]|nr:TonB-dependent receptor [Pyrinomonadaceae bacterium]